MFCNISIQHPFQMTFSEFRDVVERMALCGAQHLVHNIMYEKEPHDEDCADPDLYYKFDNKVVIRNDTYEQVKIEPFVKRWIMKAIVDELAVMFCKSMLDQYHGSQADVGNTPHVKYSSTHDEWIAFVFGAELNCVRPDQEIWQNVKVDIRYIKVPEDKDGSSNQKENT